MRINRITPQSKTDQAVALLTDMITSGGFESGMLLPPEHELCDRVGVSRSTLRMALRTLEARGLVETKHGIGAVVTNRTSETLADSIDLMLRRGGGTRRDVFEIRLMLECLAASLGARRAEAKHIAAIETSISAMAGGTTIQTHISADLDFHIAVAESSGNEVLVAFVRAVRQQLLETIAATFARDGGVPTRIDDHTAILLAIQARDPPGAEAAMRRHLERTVLLLEDPVSSIESWTSSART